MKHTEAPGKQARFAMYGRLLRCPVGDNPEDCPLHEIRKLPVEERLAWLDSKSDEEVVKLYHQHNACLHDKQTADGSDPAEIEAPAG